MISRRSVLAAPFILTAAAIPVWPAFARAPLAGATTPPVYRFKLGSFEVTAIADGTLDLTTDLFPAAEREPQTAQRLLAQAAVSPESIPIFVNAYVVNTGDRLVLIDTGTARAMGPSLGQLPRNLAAAGIEPASIDVVLLTHMHPDHAAGLATAEGNAAFPKSEVIVAEADYAYWTSKEIASRAPADAQPFFELARDVVKPYVGRIRRIADAGEVVAGITLEPAPGHTPGHSMFRISSGSSEMLVWGDIVHAVAFQFDQPDWTIAFDVDQRQAADTRRRVFDMVSRDRLLIAGMHLPFPGLGYVARRGTSFAYVPQLWPTGG